MSTQTSETDPDLVSALVDIKAAQDATSKANKVITSRKTQYPHIRAVRITKASDTGLAKFRNRLKTLGVETTQDRRPDINAALLAAESDVVDALISETHAWEKAEEAITGVLVKYRKAVDKAEAALEKATHQAYVRLAQLLDEQPNFPRKQFSDEVHSSREVILVRIRAIKNGTVVVDHDQEGHLDDAWNDAKRAFITETKARKAMDAARQERKQVVVDIHHTSPDGVPLTQVARAAGLSVPWMREFLAGSRTSRSNMPAPRLLLDQQVPAAS